MSSLNSRGGWRYNEDSNVHSSHKRVRSFCAIQSHYIVPMGTRFSLLQTFRTNLAQSRDPRFESNGRITFTENSLAFQVFVHVESHEMVNPALKVDQRIYENMTSSFEAKV